MNALKVTFFGGEGSFSQMAGRRRFPKARLTPGHSAARCFEDLRTGKTDVIIVPIENASGGMIEGTVDEIIRFGEWNDPAIAVREELTMTIELVLMGNVPLGKIRKIYSHRAPFDHCHEWLRTNMPDVQRVVCASTTEAAQAAAKDPTGAAIASRDSARIYKLKVITADVGRNAVNITKFFVIGKTLKPARRPTRSTLFFLLAHKVGALCDVLLVLKKNRINMTRITSRPIYGRQNEYTFMVEVEGASSETHFDKAFKQLVKVTDRVWSVGSYPTVKI